MQSYLMPAREGAGEYTEKRSRFLGRIWPVESEAEALAHIAATKKLHHDARHNCFAYLLRDGGTVRYSDDGEPQGTAGQPMLAVLNGAGLENVCCVVTRYFGGVLLGTGGLVRAYTEAAKLALADAGVQRMALWRALELRCPYALFERAKRLLEAQEAVIERTDYGAEICICALLRADRTEDFAAALREASAGALAPQWGEERFCGVTL